MCNCLKINIRRFIAGLLQDKEMTVKCDRERVPAEHSSQLLVNTLSFFYFFIIFIIILIFKVEM